MKYVIGIDEVGRGALAGPVAVAAVCMPRGLRFAAKRGVLRDSKKLTAKQREEWARYIKSHQQIVCAIARVYPRGIERLNISGAANLAAERAQSKVAARLHLKAGRYAVLLDGGLFLGNGKQPWPLAGQAGRPMNARTIVKGDEKVNAIKLASIVAKVHRDRLMVRLARKYPEYGFEVHKGYGTKRHLAAIKRHGPSNVHRLTFLKKYAKIEA